jgi:hypothetical protein
LFPSVKRAGQENTVSTVIPGELGEDVNILVYRFGRAIIIERKLSAYINWYSELTKFIELARLLLVLFLNELLEFPAPIYELPKII